MSSYIESKIIIGLPTEEVFKSMSDYEESNMDLTYKNFYNETKTIDLFNQEFETIFEGTFIGLAIDNENMHFELSSTFFKDYLEEIDYLTQIFKDKFKLEPKMFSVYYRY